MNPTNGNNRSSSDGAPTGQPVVFEPVSQAALGQPGSSLEANPGVNVGALDAPSQPSLDSSVVQRPETGRRRRIIRFGILGLVILIGLGMVLLRQGTKDHTDGNTQNDASQRYGSINLPLADLGNGSSDLQSLQKGQTLSVNGQLHVRDSIVLTPGLQPSSAVAGELYYDKKTNQLSYYNGNQFVNVLSGNGVVQSLGGASGDVTLGSGLTQAGGTLTNSGVLSLQGQTGNVSLTGGSGVDVNGTTLTNTGVLSVGGQTGNISLGSGLNVAGGQLKNTGILSAVSGSANITVTNDGNGNITISSTGGGTGTVQSPGGTIGTIPVFTGVQTIADSLLSQSGGTVTVTGNLSITGSLSLGTPLSVTNGGTGATTSAGARTNLGAAASGANSDITSLSGLTTPLSVVQGGTGASSFTANSILLGNGTSAITALTGSNGQCLLIVGSAPTFGTCPGSAGVTSLDGLTGTITIANTSGAGSTITINDATTAAKGIASFSATNFTVTGGAVNTIQNISTTAAPTFNALTLTNALTVANGGTGATSLATNGVIVGQGTGALTSVVAGGAGLCLVSTAGAPAWSACPGSGGVTSVNGLSGIISLANASAAGSTITIDNAKADGSTKGLATFNSTNFTDNGSGVINTVQNINSTASPTFSSLTLTSALSVQGASGATFGIAGTTAGTLNIANGTNSQLSILKSAAPTGIGNVTFNLPSAAGGTTQTLCTIELGNCAGSGGGVTTTGGTTNRLAKFTGSQTIADSIIADNGSTVTVNGDLSVTGNLSLTNALTVGNGGTGATSFTANGVLIGNGGSAITAIAAGSAGQCLVSTAGAPTWTTCPGSGGVTSVNGLTGAITIANAGVAGSTITINNAKADNGTTKGIASFNSTNFSDNGSGVINTIQNINSSATPTFGGLTLTGALQGTGATLSNTLAVQGAGGITVGVGGTTAGAINIANGTNSQLAILQVSAPTGTGNVTFNLPSAAGGTTQTICTIELGNCAGSGGGITGSGTNGKIAKFTGTGTIADSILSESAGTVTAAGNFVIQGASGLTLGVAGPSGTDGVLTFANSLGSHTVSLQAPSSDPASNLVFKLPSSYGSNGDCLESDGAGGLTFTSCTGGAGGGVTSLNGQTGVVNLANASGSGGVITINNAKADNGTTKGIASFNSTNFTDNGSGVINTVQNINISATPSFGGLTLTGVLQGTSATLSSANSLTLGTASTNTGSIVFKGSGGTGTLTLSGPTTPNAGNFTISLPAVGANATICVDTGNCTAAGAAGGDLSGTYPNPTVTGLNGTALNITSLATNDVLQYNGTNWVNGHITNANLTSGTYAAITGVGALTAGSIAGGFGTISTANNITTSALLQGGTINGGSSNQFQVDSSGHVVAVLSAITGTSLVCQNASNQLSQCDSSYLAPTTTNFIQNQNASTQTGNFKISGTGIAGAFQAGSFDTASAGTLAIGNTNATTINVGNNALAHTINIGTDATTVQNINIGSQNTTSATTLQGGDAGITFKVNGSSTAAYDYQVGGVAVFDIDSTGRAVFQNRSNTGAPGLAVKEAGGATIFDVDTQTRQSVFRENGILVLQGGITNQSSLLFTGTNTYSAYTSPDGFSTSAKIAISNFDVGSFNAIIYAGIKNTDSSTARGFAIFDQRGYDPGTVTYTPTNVRPAISLLSPGEDDEFGISWDGSDCRTTTNCVAKLKTQNTNSSIAIAPNDVPYIKAFSNGAVGLGAVAAGATSQAAVVNIQGAAFTTTAGGNGNAASDVLDAIGTKGQTTIGNTGQVAGTGGGILLQGGDGGDAPSGSTNGNGGNIKLSAGKGGSGAGTAGASGSVIVQNQADSTIAFTVQNTANKSIFTVDTTNDKITLGNPNTDTGKLVFANAANTNTITMQIANQTVNSATITIPNLAGVSDTVCLVALANCLGGPAGGANTSLSNLTSTSINQSLLPDATANNRDLGDATHLWRSGYFSGHVYLPDFDTASASALTIGATNASSITLGKSSGTSSITFGNTTSGGVVTNNGATLNTAKALGNFAANGAIGTAAATVDNYTSFTINQTTAGITLTIPNPTNATAGRVIYIANIGTQSLVVGGVTLSAGTNATFFWNGTAWSSTAVSTGVTLVGAFSGTSVANGASISGNTITFGPADTTNPGMVSTGTQTFTGQKSFAFTGTNAFRIQNTGGTTTLLNADTTNGQVTISGVSDNSELVIKAATGQTASFIKLQDASGGGIADLTATTDGSIFFGKLVGNIGASSGSENIAIGDSTLYTLTTGTNNIAIGEEAAHGLTTGSGNNAIGQWALYQNATGTGNNALGGGALFNATGDLNTAIGDSALVNTTTGSDNTAVGERAGMSNTTGSGNNAFGHSAGDRDYLGVFYTSGNLQDATAIGTYAQVQKSYTITLGSVDEGTQVVVGATVPVSTNLFGVSPVDINSSVRASQTSGSGTITAASAVFSASNVGEELVWADGTTETITGYTDSTHVTGSSTTITETNQFFRTHRIGFQVTNTGTAYIQQTSTSAFQVMNTAGTVLLAADTTNSKVTVGSLFTADVGASTITFGTASNGVIFTPTGGLVATGTARHTKTITLPAEYAGAVLDSASDTAGSCNTNNSGTMTSAYDSINRMNYYNWTATNPSTAQCYDVVVQVPIPKDFSSWAASTPMSIQLKKDSTGTAAYAIQILNSSGSGDTTFCAGGGYCSPGTLSTSWGNMVSSGSFASSGYTAGDYFTIKIRLSSTNGANVSLGNIVLNYSSSF